MTNVKQVLSTRPIYSYLLGSQTAVKGFCCRSQLKRFLITKSKALGVVDSGPHWLNPARNCWIMLLLFLHGLGITSHHDCDH